MNRYGPLELLVLPVVTMMVTVAVVVPFWRIFSRAGYPGIMSLMMLIPGLNLIMLYFLAFSEWPSLRRAAEPPPYPRMHR